MSKIKALKELIASKASQVTPEKLRFTADQQRENIANVGSAVKQKAQELNDQYVNGILGYDVQARYDDILKPRGIVFKDMHPLEEAALFGGAAFLTSAGANAAASGNDEEDFERWAEEKGVILN